jgi:hypothetical protein
LDENSKKIGDLIPATLKRSKSYHSELEKETLSKIKELSKGFDEIAYKAKDMLKLFNHKRRLSEKFKQKGRL